MELTMPEALNISVTGFIVVFIVLILLALVILVLSKLIGLFTPKGKDSKKKAEKAEKVADTAVIKADAPAPVPAANTAAPARAAIPFGSVELYKTGEKTAAAVMAIISHETGIPLNRLDFKSIRLKDDLELYKTDDKTAAAIMAITSHQTKIPLDRLVFKSIKLIEK